MKKNVLSLLFLASVSLSTINCADKAAPVLPSQPVATAKPGYLSSVVGFFWNKSYVGGVASALVITALMNRHVLGRKALALSKIITTCAKCDDCGACKTTKKSGC